MPPSMAGPPVPVTCATSGGLGGGMTAHDHRVPWSARWCKGVIALGQRALLKPVAAHHPGWSAAERVGHLEDPVAADMLLHAIGDLRGAVAKSQPHQGTR